MFKKYLITRKSHEKVLADKTRDLEAVIRKMKPLYEAGVKSLAMKDQGYTFRKWGEILSGDVFQAYSLRAIKAESDPLKQLKNFMKIVRDFAGPRCSMFDGRINFGDYRMSKDEKARYFEIVKEHPDQRLDYWSDKVDEILAREERK